MPWFNVDDGFHSHPKALATSLAARGLWVTAGSWASDNLTDGVIPRHVLASLGSTPTLENELVAAGLWKKHRKGYVFHDWAKCNPTSKQVLELRAKRAAAGRKGGASSANTRSKRQANASAHASPVVEPQEPFAFNKAKAAPNGRASPTGTAAKRGKPKPPWCGTCHETTRQTGDPPMRCPRCHPLATGLEAESWQATHAEVYRK